MVPISSVRISRVPTYSGFRSRSLDFVYRNFTFFVLPFQISSTIQPTALTRSVPQRHYSVGLGCSDFARHYFRNRFCFLFLRVLRCFSSPGSPCIPIYSVCNNTMLLVLSSLIRISADLKIFAPPRSFSQLVTSFFGAMYQGILRKPFVAWSFSFIYSSLLLFNRKFYFSYSTNLLRISRALKLLLTSFALLTKLALQLIWISLPFVLVLLFPIILFFLLCSC